MRRIFFRYEEPFQIIEEIFTTKPGSCKFNHIFYITRMDQLIVKKTSWQQDQELLLKIRFEVFVDEQHVPEDEETDEHDPEALHVIAYLNNSPVGTGRMLRDGTIGRMAVRKPYRGSGVGEAILNFFIREGEKNGFETLRLSSQTHARGFYAKFGFEAVGDEYDDAGIPHITMIRKMS